VHIETLLGDGSARISKIALVAQEKFKVTVVMGSDPHLDVDDGARFVRRNDIASVVEFSTNHVEIVSSRVAAQTSSLRRRRRFWIRP
jgi:hypothetical protein